MDNIDFILFSFCFFSSFFIYLIILKLVTKYPLGYTSN